MAVVYLVPHHEERINYEQAQVALIQSTDALASQCQEPLDLKRIAALVSKVNLDLGRVAAAVPMRLVK